MRISDYIDLYISLSDGSSGYRDQLRWALSALEKHAGKSLQLADLSESLINEYLAATRDTLAPQTRVSRRNMLLRLWKHAAGNVDIEGRPARPNRDSIGKVRRRQRSPRGWTADEVRRLLLACDGCNGMYAGKMSRRSYWRAWVLAAWSSGLRRVDLCRLHVAEISPVGRAAILQAKTGRTVVVQFSHEAMAAIAELAVQHGEPLVFPSWCRLSTWRKIAKRLVARAGIGGSIGRLRHSAGTAVENAHPGMGPQFLGNTPQVFYAHYYDRQLAVTLPSPPPLLS